MSTKDLQALTVRLERAVEAVWDPAADADEALESVAIGHGRVQLRPHPRLIERVASEFDRLGEAEATFTVEVRDELARARSKFGPVASLHEGYAVILEELDEFWEDVRSKDPERLNRAYRELVQVAAMAQRTAEDVIARLTVDK